MPNYGRNLLPRILSRSSTGTALHLRLQLASDLVFFDGHFEGAPILAGVVQVDWAVRFAQDAFAISNGQTTIEALKFFRILPSGSEINLDIVYESEKHRLSFRYFEAAEDYSSGRIVFRSES